MIRDELNQHDRAGLAYPEPPPTQNGAPILHHGYALLAYLMREGEAYGLLSDVELIWADHAACQAISAPEITVPALQRISAVRHRIATSLRVRAAECREKLRHVANVAPSRPPEGPMARLAARPRVNPPAGVAIRF